MVRDRKEAILFRVLVITAVFLAAIIVYYGGRKYISWDFLFKKKPPPAETPKADKYSAPATLPPFGGVRTTPDRSKTIPPDMDLPKTGEKK